MIRDRNPAILANVTVMVHKPKVEVNFTASIRIKRGRKALGDANTSLIVT